MISALPKHWLGGWLISTPVIAFANDAFLYDRSDQPAVAREDQPARATPRPMRARAILGVKEPFVCPERAMEPQRVIKARWLNRALEHSAAMRDQGRVDGRNFLAGG